MRDHLNLYERQARNRRATVMVVGLFILFLAFLGAGFDLFLLGIGRGFPLPVATLAAILVGSASAWAGARNGDRAVLASAGAIPLEDWTGPSSQVLGNIVDEMTIASGLPRPRTYVIPDDDPNAFATGWDPAHASLAVTRGLLKTLTREELQGVVAHEMSHIKNLDIRLMTVIAALTGSVLLLSDWAARSLRFGGEVGARRGKGKTGGALLMIVLVVWVVSILVAPFVAQLLAMLVSRKRESLADASGAELTRNPLGLAKALERIEAVVTPTAAIKRGVAHLCIVDPLGRRLTSRRGALADLLATHPPMAERIAALREMAYEAPTPPSVG